MGDITPGVLYRASSPIDPGQGDRRFVVDRLMKKAGVAAAVNTSDCRFMFKGFVGFDDTYYASVEQVALNMGRDYPSEAYLEDLRNGLDFMSEFPGPYLVHGTQGAERAGYVCMVLEALMGAAVEEVKADYLRSFSEYYQVPHEDPVWAELESQAEENLLCITGCADEAALAQVDLARATERYLLDTVKLSQNQLDALKANLARK